MEMNGCLRLGVTSVQLIVIAQHYSFSQLHKSAVFPYSKISYQQRYQAWSTCGIQC